MKKLVVSAIFLTALVIQCGPLFAAGPARDASDLFLRAYLQIQEGDCRTFDVTRLLGAQKFHHIDLFVSELLGGFGDNELWPECLQPFEAHCRTLNGAGRYFSGNPSRRSQAGKGRASRLLIRGRRPVVWSLLPSR